jgi:uncharacterized protein YcbK (DUF882 family)
VIVVSINNTKNLFDENNNLLQNKLLVTKNLFDENNNLLQNKLFVTEPNKFSLLQNIKKLFGAENKIMQGCYFVMVNSKSVLFKH